MEMWDTVRGTRAQDRRQKKHRLMDKQKRLTNSAFLASLQGFMEDGAFSKAVKHLVSDGLHDSLEEPVRAELRKLHPLEPPVSNPPQGTPGQLDLQQMKDGNY